LVNMLYRIIAFSVSSVKYLLPIFLEFF